jgi:hypothetical protein
MKIVPLEKTKLTLPDVAALAKGGAVILTRGGKPLAAIKDLAGFDWESVSLSNNPRFRALIEKSRRSHREQGGISLAEVRRELGLRATRPAPRRKKST